MYQSGDLQCDVVVNPMATLTVATHPASSMQRIDLQLYTDKRNGRDELRMDTCNGSRYHTCWTNIRDR